MKIVLASIGTTGDSQPFFALGKTLQARGHEITIALSGHFGKRAQDLGFQFRQIGQDDDKSLTERVAISQMRNDNPAVQVRSFLSAIVPRTPAMYTQLLEISQGADMIVSTPFQFAAHMVAQKLGIKFATVHLSPFGSQGGAMIRSISEPIVNSMRLSLGFPAVKDPLGTGAASPQLALFAVSPLVFKAPLKWPSHYKMPGYFFLDEPEFDCPKDLLKFLDEGEKPVVISLGSMPSENPTVTSKIFIEAIGKAGMKAVIQYGGADLAKNVDLPENIFGCGFVPHGFLFSKGLGVVHHGGAGTTAAVFRSGAPSIFVPHLLDQPLWAEYARAMGTSAGTLPIKDLNPEALVPLLQNLKNKTSLAESAGILSEKIKKEDGCQAACNELEALKN